MVRAAAAPKETSKFMGHGVCDSFSRSSTLATATDEAAVIRREAKMLAKQLGIKHEDLRGVGVQVGRNIKCTSSGTYNLPFTGL